MRALVPGSGKSCTKPINVFNKKCSCHDYMLLSYIMYSRKGRMCHCVIYVVESYVICGVRSYVIHGVESYAICGVESM